MSLSQTKCDCGEIVPLTRSQWKFDYYEGVCPKCKIRQVRILFKCRQCERYTLHKSLGTKIQPSKDKYGHTCDQPVEHFKCEVCGLSTKAVFRGLKSSYERGMM